MQIVVPESSGYHIIGENGRILKRIWPVPADCGGCGPSDSGESRQRYLRRKRREASIKLMQAKL